MKHLWIFLLLLTTAVWAQPRWMDRDDTRPRHGRMMERLNLAEDQQKQFDKLQSDHQKKQLTARSRIQLLRIDVRDEFRQDKPDRGKIESKLAEISKLQNDMKMNQVGSWFDVNKMLTADQQKVWKEHRRGVGPGGGEDHQRGGKPGGSGGG